MYFEHKKPSDYSEGFSLSKMNSLFSDALQISIVHDHIVFVVSFTCAKAETDFVRIFRCSNINAAEFHFVQAIEPTGTLDVHTS